LSSRDAKSCVSTSQNPPPPFASGFFVSFVSFVVYKM
jgi:hypothetical protein